VIVLPYNSLVSKEQDVKRTWSNIKVQIQRQVDLIPQLLAQQNISMVFEQSFLTNITNLRTQWLNTLANNTGENVNVSAQLFTQMGTLIQTVEEYPNPASIETIRDINVELSGAYNRIAAARIFYNDAVGAYNSAVHSFPSNMIAGSFGFQEAAYFQE
jgi:LemA protein